MMDNTDADVQEELQAMIGAPKVPLFGANRAIPRSDLRAARLSRQIFLSENSGTSMNALNSHQQPNRNFSPPPPSLILSSTEKATKNELEAILRKPAHTVEEKFLALEARDKLIRLTTVRNVDIKMATSTQGVCPDMCPEKERLSRESKHRVANFELEEGSKSIMNHVNAVKEYSRSSADQESPLPHELRPEPVLKLTMTYLLQNIMDLCDNPDTSISDWYHFLWDRTRSIRKEITQQELCSTETVLLVEQCARFHIHCAARLVAEEPQVFDQRINTENLTKCLQSLKYIYHDLGLKMIRCPNEGEFRAYVVLLNLHDSNFLWEVKQLREELQQSPEIQFAIKVYLALESNNYVRFFALVRSTTYMNACILLRYFTQVRVKALHIMFKAYAPRNAVFMPISNLTYLLAFEDAEQCAQFLEYYGLSCERDYDRVLFDRTSFFLPDNPYMMERAINVIEHKRHSSVGEAVYGAQLDAKNVLERYEPHNSFDENGILLPRAWSADDQNYYKPEARMEARLSKATPFTNKDDESVFKMPLAPPKSSPKSRLSPKTIPTSDNNTSNSSSSSSIFGSSKFTPSTQSSSSSSGFFKVPQSQAPSTNNLFGGFGESSSQTNSFGNSATNSGEKHTQPMIDVSDGGAFKSTGNSAFGKPVENGAIFGKPAPNNCIFGKPAENTSIFGKSTENTATNHSLFSSGFSQKSENTSLFAQVKPASNSTQNAAFGNAASNAPSMFGGFTAANSNQPSGKVGFISQSASTSSSQSVGTSIFGGYRDNSMIPGVKPLKQTDREFDGKREEEYYKLEEMLRKEKEAKEAVERKKKEEIEEQEHQRKTAEKEKKRQMEVERKRLEIKSTANKCVEEIIDEFVSSELEVFTNVEIKRHRALEEKITKIYADLTNEVVDEELMKVALNVKNAWDKNILEKYFASWRKMTRKKKEQRQKIANTPMWLPTRSMQDMIPELHHPLQSKTLSLMKRYRSGLPSKLIAPPIREDKIDSWSIITPELIKLTARNKTIQTQNIYWKCVISLPDTDENSSSKTISQWLDNIFYRQLSKHPRQNDIFFVEQHDHNNLRMNVCMRKLIGKRLLNESNTPFTAKDVDGTNAILFFMSTTNLHATRARLKAVLKAIELHNAAGLVIYSLDGNDLNEVKDALNLYDFMDYDKADECVFANGIRNCGNNNLCHLTKQTLKYVAANSLYDDQLEMQQIISFLRICLADELWQRIHLSINRNPTLLEASTRFNFLVDYHNEAIDRLISVCKPSIDSPMLFPFELRQFVPKHQLDIPLGLEYFPENWHRTAEEHQKQLVAFLKTLQIHQQIDLKNVIDTASLERTILTFVSEHIPRRNDAERTAYKMIQNILAYLGPRKLNTFEFKEKLSKYSWLDAFPIFATDLLSIQYQRFVNEHRLPDYVIYDKYEYQDYTRNAWWLQTNEHLLKELTANVLQNIDATVDEYEQTCKRQKLEETVIAAEEKKSLDDILTKGYASLANADKTLNRMKEIQSTCKNISKDFDYGLFKNEKFMRDLKHTWKDLNE